MNARVKLQELTRKVHVVAHKEDTSTLEKSLIAQGLHVLVHRGPYHGEQHRYSAQMKCLVNHANVWRAVAAGNVPAIVLEADFIPVRRFSEQWSPLPNVPDDASVGFAWLYSAGSILYGFDVHGFPHGHGNTTVAYVLTPRVAAILLDFYDREITRNEAGTYSQWETYLGIFLRKEMGILNHIPIYQYGEHGGLPQPEHLRQGIRAWHQADVLLGPLAFLPGYAQNKMVRYMYFRLRAITRGWVRLFLLRFYDPRYINDDTTRGKAAMAWFSVARLLRMVR